MWLVEYDEDVKDYLKNSGWIVLLLHKSIVGLGFTDDGLPKEGELTDHDDGLYWWIIAGHSLLLWNTGSETYVLEIYAGELRIKEEIEEKLSQYRN